MTRYALGIDFGSLSGRALLVDVATGHEVGSAVSRYKHGFIEETLPATGEKLPPDWTIQDPQDYLDVLDEAVPELLRATQTDPADIIGIGIDFTACTLLPVAADGTPLCFLPTYRGNKHAYAKKWKHHAAQPLANRINAVASARGEPFLARYGGKVSSEWLFPKLLQIVEEDPSLYAATDRFIDAGDWIVWQLTGRETHNSCAAGYKAFWNKRDGYPANDFFTAVDPRLDGVIGTKIASAVMPVGCKAGELTPAAAARLGLRPGTAVAAANVDAHVSLPGAGVTGTGQMLLIIGTSTCNVLCSDQEVMVPGICGIVEDGILPGLFGYEAGQSCSGDHFDWFIKNCLPETYSEEARNRGLGIHKVLRDKARLLAPGESGLLALDWWNGNRSILVDVDLTGLILGMSLLTRPEEIYRALIEATAFGQRAIIENFERYGIPVRELYACGGIAAKDDLTMQIYADVTRRPITLSASEQTSALGAAMFGAVAAGPERGGYLSIYDAVRAMARRQQKTYYPDVRHAAAYDRLFAEYQILHDYFGRGANDVMKRLKEMRRETQS
jgi:L-ribulokinase